MLTKQDKASMIYIILSLAVGIAFGYIFKPNKSHRIQHVITILIWALLFMLGMGIGSDDSLFASLPTIGLLALAIGAATTLGSAAFAWLLCGKNKSRKQ